MNRQRRRMLFTGLGVVLLSATFLQAQVIPEVFLQSYPNADITVDGDPSDWNIAQFSTIVVGGVVPAGGVAEDWQRVGGVGDIALLGWDDDESAVFYGSKWTASALPEERSDNQVKFYARDNSTHQYFLVDIMDDEINMDDDAAWANDSVEFYFDPTWDRGATAGGVPAWESDVQLVIDAGNAVQVWNSPPDYELQVEAGVESAVTITETGWMLEVGIDKSVFDVPLPAILSGLNGQGGGNYGIDLSYRDNDDPENTGTRNGDNLFTTDYVWADPNPEPGFPTKIPDNWGVMIAGDVVTPVSVDFDQNGLVDVDDVDALVEAIIAMTNNLDFDLTLDGIVDESDLSRWLADAATTNGFTEPYLKGDANLDGTVNAGDLNSLAVNWQSSTGAWSSGDFDADNNVNASDLNELGVNWLKSVPTAAAAVPEPSTLFLIGLSILSLFGWRRRIR